MGGVLATTGLIVAKVGIGQVLGTLICRSIGDYVDISFIISVR